MEATMRSSILPRENNRKSHDQEFEIQRLRIMEEVGTRFDDLVKELNERGTEFSREMRVEMAADIDRIRKEAAEILYKTKSLDQAIKLIMNEKDGLLHQALAKVEDAVSLTGKAAKSAESSCADVRTSRDFLTVYGIITGTAFAGLVITVIF